ncbi:MAG: hypothetical protein WBA12_00740 [Catalinimonas sp.]
MRLTGGFTVDFIHHSGEPSNFNDELRPYLSNTLNALTDGRIVEPVHPAFHVGVNVDVGRIRLAYKHYYFLRENFYRPLVVAGEAYQIGGAALQSFHFSVGFFLRRRSPSSGTSDGFFN